MFPGCHSGETVWTFVNRGAASISGPQLRVNNTENLYYYDCYHGTELTPIDNVVSFDIEVLGYGCVLATPNHTAPGSADPLGQFLAAMRAMTAEPLGSFNSTWTYLMQHRVSHAATALYTQAPVGMVDIPAGIFHFMVNGVEIEGRVYKYIFMIIIIIMIRTIGRKETEMQKESQ